MVRIATTSDLFPEIDGLPFRMREHFADIREEPFWAVYERFKPFTLVGIERFHDVYCHTRYIAEAGIPGDFVECGVWPHGGRGRVRRELRYRGADVLSVRFIRGISSRQSRCRSEWQAG